MKCKLIYFHSDKTFEIVSKNIKKGNVKMGKEDEFAIDKAEPLLLSHSKGLSSMIALFGLLVSAMIAFMLPEAAGMAIAAFAGLAVMMKVMEGSASMRAVTPAYIVKWNNAMPMRFAKWIDKEGNPKTEPFKKATDKPKTITTHISKAELTEMALKSPVDPVPISINTKPDIEVDAQKGTYTVYTSSFGEVEIENQPALSPDNFKQLGTQGVLKQLLTLKKTEKVDMMMWLIMGGVIGFLAANFVMGL